MNENISNNESNEVVIHTTQDKWEAQFLKAALLNANISCKMQSEKGEDGKRVMQLIVPGFDQIEAMEVVSRVSLASTELELNQEEPEEYPEEERSEEEESQARDNEEESIPQAMPDSTTKEVIAKRSGIGEVVHYVGHGYELKVGPEPYPMVPEDRWEEFLNFSAQRQEFSFLLRNEYEDLYNYVKEEKQMAEFIHLVESTYREVPPPRSEKKRKPINNFAKLSLILALGAILSVILQLSWYAELAFGILTGFMALMAKYQVDKSEGEQRGNAMAILSIIISSAVIAISLLRS